MMIKKGGQIHNKFRAHDGYPEEIQPTRHITTQDANPLAVETVRRFV
jgi:hypothetical protein